MNTSEQLRARILEEIERLEHAKEADSKNACRSLHSPAVRQRLLQAQEWIATNLPRYVGHFANGSEVNPSRISPSLIEVTEKWHSDLFRLARYTWSLPYTKGYGRRLRFLIVDEANNRLIGILGLQSPPLDFPVRDRRFTYPEGRKIELVNQTMDIYTLGALPPYSRLLGGKLVALAAASNEVRTAYNRKYTGRVTEIDERRLPAHLVALTTTSAFGRSSIYNRLKYGDRLVAQSIGYTEGYGSFHLAPLYQMVREYLEQQGVSTRGGFGVGPRIVWQTYVRALGRLGLPRDLLKHGVRREAFLFPLTSNLKDYMEGRATEPAYYFQPFDDLAEWWRERWLLARAERVDGWLKWDRGTIEQMLIIKR